MFGRLRKLLRYFKGSSEDFGSQDTTLITKG